MKTFSLPTGSDHTACSGNCQAGAGEMERSFSPGNPGVPLAELLREPGTVEVRKKKLRKKIVLSIAPCNLPLPSYKSILKWSCFVARGLSLN